jgi:hypothetical protein
MKTLLAAVVLAPTAFSANAGTEQFAFSSGGASANGFGEDSCQFVFVEINVARSGIHNLNNPSSSGFAQISLQLMNFCTNTFVFEGGSTSNFQFSAPGAPDSIPKSVQASGTMTTSCCFGPDTLTFSLNLQAVSSTTIEQQTTSKQTSFGVTTEEHFDNNILFTTGTVSVTSANYGTLPISSWQTQVNDQHSHSLTISN